MEHSKVSNLNLLDLIQTQLWAKVLIGLFLGVVVGMLLGPDLNLVSSNTSHIITNWIALPGSLFLKLIQMIMIPLLISSVMYGIGNMNQQDLKQSGGWVAIYFIVTTFIAVLVGLTIVLLINPGKYSQIKSADLANITIKSKSGSPISIDPTDALNYLIPSNPFSSMVNGEMLPLVLFAIIVGVTISQMEKSKTGAFLTGIYSIQEITLAITKWAMKLSPYAVFGLITQIVSRVGIQVLLSLGMYIFTVIIGLLIHSLIYVFIVQVMAKYSFKHFIVSIKDVILLAFSTATSAAVMPLSIRVAEEKLKANPIVTRFIIPVGATISMDGTALYQTVATVYIAQLYGIELTVPQILLLSVTTVLASIGTPSAPGAGILVLGTILTSVGIPLEGISIIIGVDRILGMARAGINVIGDLAAVVLFTRKMDTEIERYT
jgi:Na+/H+-dicarboxylate symporter